MTNVDASAKNMEAVCKAKEAHDKSCPWGGKANQVHLSWFDLERIGWEEGDVICGLVVVGDLIGSGEAQERGVVGETPNLAARLQSLAEAQKLRDVA